MNLSDDILQLLTSRPGLKARQIANTLGVDRRTVNSALYGELRGRVTQARDYTWSVVGASGAVSRRDRRGKPKGPSHPDNQVAPIESTPAGRLLRYYLDCIALDDEAGISVYAASQFSLDYVELPNHPALAGDFGVLHELDEARRLCGEVTRGRSQKSAYLGHAVFANKIRSRRGWEGFLLQPLFIHPLSADPETKSLSTEDLVPLINLDALKGLTGNRDATVANDLEALQLDLGLLQEPGELPDFDELLMRLRDIRPEWPWVEQLDPYAVQDAQPLSKATESGIYNRALLLVAERPSYTQGLETELNQLRKKPADGLSNTALGHFISPSHERVAEAQKPEPLLEVFPMNAEQRLAVRKSLSEPLTVITGPPGTGKSQVVSSILVNAAWRGQRVLFASRNNKAVDVVETRVNALGARPMLLRLGANAYNDKLIDFLAALLSVSATEQDQESFEIQTATHSSLTARLAELESTIEDLANLLSAIAHRRQMLELEAASRGESVMEALWSTRTEDLESASSRLRAAATSLDPSNRRLLSRLFGKFRHQRRLDQLAQLREQIEPLLKPLGVTLPSVADGISPDDWYAACDKLDDLIDLKTAHERLAADQDVLSSMPSLEELAKQEADLSDSLERISASIWKIWLVLQPSRLSAQQRELLGDYATTLKALQDAARDSGRPARGFARRYNELFPKISEVLTCWAVTSLSANRRVPLEPGFFDLVLIDEASQCDIASIVPLLYRARRAAIIGDPMQLSHISSLRRDQDERLLEKHDLADSHVRWSYRTNSAYALAAPLATSGNIIDLREHHRSHLDVIEFSNQHFYEGKLRVATSYGKLRTPPGEPAVRWIDVQGRSERHPQGGSFNRQEATAVLGELRRLLVDQAYQGTVGVVSPFRAQANLIREMIHGDQGLTARMASAELLVDTVHRFQGDERDVMIFSPVVSEGVPQGSIGFLRKTANLFNVAITRARAALIVVGNKRYAADSGVEHLAAFASYTDQIRRSREKRAGPDPSTNGKYPAVSRPELVSDWERRFYRSMFAAGLRPIPQYEVEKYVLDFALIEGDRRLNIEVDGETHRSWDGDRCRRDIMRNQRMIELGWDVMRFWVHELESDTASAVMRVKRWVEDPGRPSDASESA